MADACTSTALHDCAFAGDALRCGVLDGLADARWSNVDELAPPALAHPSDALLTALLISRGRFLHVRGRFWRPGEELGWQPCAYSMRAANAECGVAAAKANHRLWMMYNRTRRGGGRGRGR